MVRSSLRKTPTVVDTGDRTAERNEGSSVEECKRCLNCGTVVDEMVYTYCGNCTTPLVRSYRRQE